MPRDVNVVPSLSARPTGSDLALTPFDSDPPTDPDPFSPSHPDLKEVPSGTMLSQYLSLHRPGPQRNFPKDTPDSVPHPTPDPLPHTVVVVTLTTRLHFLTPPPGPVQGLLRPHHSSWDVRPAYSVNHTDNPSRPLTSGSVSRLLDRWRFTVPMVTVFHLRSVVAPDSPLRMSECVTWVYMCVHTRVVCLCVYVYVDRGEGVDITITRPFPVPSAPSLVSCRRGTNRVRSPGHVEKDLGVPSTVRYRARTFTGLRSIRDSWTNIHGLDPIRLREDQCNCPLRRDSKCRSSS